VLRIGAGRKNRLIRARSGADAVILAGDVGGTKTHLALFEPERSRLRLASEEKFASADFDGLEAVVRRFLEREEARVSRACLGVAGPVRASRCRATNLPWEVDGAQLARALSLERVELLNDLEAAAYGILALPDDAFAVLNAGEPEARGAIAVIAAGTGLGEAALVWGGSRYVAVPSEGGHADFAPRHDLEAELFRHLASLHGHVSYERVLSGPGKTAVYRFLQSRAGAAEPAWVAEALGAQADPSPMISELGVSGRAPLCASALELFASIYGAEAGNLALKFLATGGVYVAGGVAPPILSVLERGGFMAAFTGKGRLSPLMQRIPVRVVLESRVALYGAARRAAGIA